MNAKPLLPLTLIAALLVPGLAAAEYLPQDNDNRDACCLAAEYRLPEARPQAAAGPAPTAAVPSQGAAEFPCQVPLGDVACCVGAEWKLGAR